MKRALTSIFIFLASSFAASAAEPEPGATKPPNEIPVKTGQRVAFVGDSITVLGNSAEGYVGLVAEGLRANGIEVKIRVHASSGTDSKYMLDNTVPAALYSKPNWLVLSCGINDVYHGLPEEEFRRACAEADGSKPVNYPQSHMTMDLFKTDLAAILEKSHATNTKLVILTPTVFYEKLDSLFNQGMVPYVEYLRTFAKENNCLLADLNADFHQILQTNQSIRGRVLTGDGVHVNSRGNQVMAKGILKAFGLNETQLAKAEQAWLDIRKQGLARNAAAKVSECLWWDELPRLFKTASVKKEDAQEVRMLFGDHLNKLCRAFPDQPNPTLWGAAGQALAKDLIGQTEADIAKVMDKEQMAKYAEWKTAICGQKCSKYHDFPWAIIFGLPGQGDATTRPTDSQKRD